LPDEIGHISLHIKAPRFVSHKEIRWELLENRTSGAKALSDRVLKSGTAEAVPFV